MPRVLDEWIDPCVRHVFAGSGYVIGDFECPPSAAGRWRVDNWIGPQAHVVVPITPVGIAARGTDPALSTPNDVLVYDPDLWYRRMPVASEGDRCLFFIVSDRLVAELGMTGAAGRAGSGGNRSSPVLRRQPLTAPTYARSRVLRTAIERPGADPSDLDEQALWLLGEIAAQVRGTPAPEPQLRTGRARREAVEEAKRLLVSDIDKVWTLAELAAAVHYSPFAFARAFRRETGFSVHRYLQQLRLRCSLGAALDPQTSLTDLAVAHGFSSHSHYTRRFREAFGGTPTELRRIRLGRAAGGRRPPAQDQVPRT